MVLRRALADAPENVTTLIQVVSARLFNSISDHTFPSAPNGSVAAYASSLIKSAGVSQQKTATDQVLNCLRVLQRVLPVVFEAEGDSDSFEIEVLWKKEEVVDSAVNDVGTAEPQFVIEDEDGSDREEEKVPQTPTKKAPKKLLPSLGERLLNAITDLMFCCGFTLPKSIQVDHHKINYVIWEKGIGSANSLGNTTMYDSNKTEVLRLLLVLLSRQIYLPAASLFTHPALPSLHIVEKMPRRDVLTILCSLLNTAMNSSTTDTITIGTIAGKLPYNHLVFKGEDPRTTLITTSLQVLCVLLDFQSGPARDQLLDGQNSSPTAKTNTFRYFIMKLHRTQDFEYLLDGIIGIMEQQIATVKNLLPGAKKSLPYVTEAIVLFWKLIEINKKFRTFVLESEKSVDLIAYLLFYCVEIKDKPQQHGVCRAISYIVQTLSAESAFGSQLSKPIKAQIPTKWGPVDTIADFMIHAVYAIVATTSGSLTSLYPALIIALSNAAPYFKHIGVSASARLLQLFNSFSNPLFLLSDEGHPRLLFFMLEVFSSIIFYHPAENSNITYGILQSRKIFEDLGTFTLARGLREVKRAQLAKEELANKSSSLKGKIPVEEGEIADAGAEKARLLHNEGVRSDSQERERESVTSPRGSQGDEPMTRSFMSPTSDNPYASESPISEKARGKMRERRSMSVENIAALDRVPLPIGRSGFVPTQEWVTSWQQGLPLDTVMLFISDVVQKVEDMQRHRTVPSADVLKFLSNVNLDHIFPTKPPISSRRFLWSDASLIWVTSLIWGEIYVHAMSPLGIWNATNVRLFLVKHTQNQQRQITETVTNVVGGFLRRTTDSAQGQKASDIVIILQANPQLNHLHNDIGNFQTINDLIVTPPQDIAKRCKASPIEIKRIVDAVLGSLPLHSFDRLSNLSLWDDADEKFSTGDAILDNALGGGIRTGMLWEIVGESSAGKTQLALQLSLFIQAPPKHGGLLASCCYLTTSAKLPTRRLYDMVNSDDPILSSFCGLDDVHTMLVPTVPTLHQILENILPKFVESQASKPGAKPVKLLVIDALGELFHSNNKTTSATLIERSKDITIISTSLHTLASTYNLAVVVLNEVIDKFDHVNSDPNDHTGILYSTQSRWFNTAEFFGERTKESSLGLTWANQINTRIMLARTGRRKYFDAQDLPKRRRIHNTSPDTDPSQQSSFNNQEEQQSISLRRLAVIFSNVASPVALDYIITSRGITVLESEVEPSATFQANITKNNDTARNSQAQSSSKETMHYPSNIDSREQDNDDALWANYDDYDYDAMEQTLSQLGQ
uniref:RecA family profile 1 domain-containing protein n=1 Tax=Psilocybe cubensis TaxID=181762 RepID=A0A8H7Y292_PSICU